MTVIKRPTLLLHGNVFRPCGFTVINRRLVDGLRAQGFAVVVAPLDGEPPSSLPLELPDVYLFHGDPYDFENTPGHLNVCFLQWEYLQVPREWVKDLNARFDLVVAPSHQARAVYQRSGLRLPIVVCPAAIDPMEFNPQATPWPAPTRKTFRFVHLGGAHQRRGTDILLRAYCAEFSADDDVVLIIKAFHYEHHKPWLRELLVRAERLGGPEICYLHETLASVAGVFTAADVGVYPLRAECLGLPVLECLACGRPVIVTENTGLNEFCSERNASFIPAVECPNGDHTGVEPDVQYLRRLLRNAYEHGKLDGPQQRRIAATVADFTWERSVRLLAVALQQGLADKRQRHHACPQPRKDRDQRPGGSAGVKQNEHADEVRDGDTQFFARVETSLQRAVSLVMDSRTKRNSRESAVLLGRTGACLELLREADAAVWKIVYGAGVPLAAEIAATNAERQRCGVPSLQVSSLALWKQAMEYILADRVLAFGAAGRASFVHSGIASEKILVAHPGIDIKSRRPRYPRPDEPVRFLFVSTQPFRDGMRLLLEAWQALRLRNGELHCAMDKSILTSPYLLRLLVANPTVILHELPAVWSPQTLPDLYARADCVVHPSLVDGLSLPVRYGMACGKPAIVSSMSSVCDQLSPETNGYKLDALDTEALVRLLSRAVSDRAALRRMGQAARETATRWTWAAFEETLAAQWAKGSEDNS